MQSICYELRWQKNSSKHILRDQEAFNLTFELSLQGCVAFSQMKKNWNKYCSLRSDTRPGGWKTAKNLGLLASCITGPKLAFVYLCWELINEDFAKELGLLVQKPLGTTEVGSLGMCAQGEGFSLLAPGIMWEWFGKA